MEDLITPAPPNGWNFEYGKSFSSLVSNLFSCPVHFSPFFGSRPFILVVDFSRFNFHLSSKSVAIALQACLGGSPHGFRVKHLKNHCYSFLVCNKNIGLYVNSIRDFTCKDFHVRFFLWGNGGPNWKREYMLWQKEEADCWTLVTRKKSSVKSGTKNAVWVAKGKSHIDKPSVFKRLFHANVDPFVRQSFQFIGSSSGTSSQSLLISKKFVLHDIGPASLHVDTLSKINVVNDNLSPRIDPSLPSGGNVTQSVVSLCNTNNGFSNLDFDSSKTLEFHSDQPVDSICNRCLAHGHVSSLCSSSIRCRACFGYGHIARFCLKRKSKESWILRLTTHSEGKNFLLERTPLSPAVTPLAIPASFPVAQPPPPKTPIQLSLPAMANLQDADFRPELFVPDGANIKVPWEEGLQGLISLCKAAS